MLHALPDPSPVTDYLIALTAFFAAVAAFLKWIRPAVREVMEAVRKANRVFDGMLQLYELPGEVDLQGKPKRVYFPDVVVHILTWQFNHDQRWPSEHELDKMTR